MDIQHRYSFILIVFRGSGFVYNNSLAQYEYKEFYVTKKTLTRTNALRVFTKQSVQQKFSKLYISNFGPASYGPYG